jgi:hypothetical protein
MPRWASRIRLLVTAFRKERLQEITEEDAKAEGVIWVEQQKSSLGPWEACAKEQYRILWNSLHHKDGGWAKNPMVRVISFKRV